MNMTPKPNSPEAFEICRRVREANRIKSAYTLSAAAEKPKKPRKPKTKITDEIIRRVYELSDECLTEDFAEWEDYKKILKDECGIDTEIRWNR